MKKFLSLVLALVMTMSLVTISAGATEYADLTDKDEIVTPYEEAVAVLNKIGVITGYSDGSFRPEVELTRGAAAKIIVSLLIGPEAANNLPNNASPYPDVPTSHTFAGVISYCKNSKIINGYSDGTFKPDGTLTGFAFAKMLLGALGYDNEIEGLSGAGWTMKVAALGTEATLFDRIDFKGGDPVTRKDAALLALNTLKATVVEYKGGSTITVGDAAVVTNPERSYKTSNQDYARNILPQRRNISEAVTSRDDYNTVEFAEEHFVDLRLPHDKYSPTDDEYGRPSAEWSYKKLSIGTFPLESDFEYTTQVIHDVETTTDAAKVRALDLNGFNVNGTNLWINGVLQTGDNALKSVAEIADYTDNGTLVQVYVNNNGADNITDVVVVKSQLMEVRRVGSDYVALDIYDDGSDGKGRIIYGFNQIPIDVNVNNVDINDEYYSFLSGLKVNDLVVVEPVAVNHSSQSYDVGHAYAPETVSGSLSGVPDRYGNVNNSYNALSVAVADTTYMVSLWNKDLYSITPDAIRITKKDVTLSLDRYGNAMLIKDVGETSDWMVVGNYRQSIVNGILVTFANGWDINGKEVSLNIGAHNTNTGGTQGNWNNDLPAIGTLVKYSNDTSSNTAEWDLSWTNASGVYNVYTGRNVQNTADYAISANSSTVSVVESAGKTQDNPDNDTTKHTPLMANNIKFIYVTMDESGELDTIEVRTGSTSVNNEELKGDTAFQNKGGYMRAQAAIELKDGSTVINERSSVKAVVIKRESSDASYRNLLYVVNYKGSALRDAQGNMVQGYEVAMMSESGLIESQTIYAYNTSLQPGDFARYTKSEHADHADDFYTLRGYGVTPNAATTSGRAAAVVSATINRSSFKGGNDRLVTLSSLAQTRLSSLSLISGSPFQICSTKESDFNVYDSGANVNGDNFADNMVNLRTAAWRDLTGNDIDSVSDLKNILNDTNRNARITLLFNDKADSDSFRNVYLIVINSLDATSGGSSTVVNPMDYVTINTPVINDNGVVRFNGRVGSYPSWIPDSATATVRGTVTVDGIGVIGNTNLSTVSWTNASGEFSANTRDFIGYANAFQSNANSNSNVNVAIDGITWNQVKYEFTGDKDNVTDTSAVKYITIANSNSITFTLPANTYSAGTYTVRQNGRVVNNLEDVTVTKLDGTANTITIPASAVNSNAMVQIELKLTPKSLPKPTEPVVTSGLPQAAPTPSGGDSFSDTFKKQDPGVYKMPTVTGDEASGGLHIQDGTSYDDCQMFVFQGYGLNDTFTLKIGATSADGSIFNEELPGVDAQAGKHYFFIQVTDINNAAAQIGKVFNAGTNGVNNNGTLAGEGTPLVPGNTYYYSITGATTGEIMKGTFDVAPLPNYTVSPTLTQPAAPAGVTAGNKASEQQSKDFIASLEPGSVTQMPQWLNDTHSLIQGIGGINPACDVMIKWPASVTNQPITLVVKDSSGDEYVESITGSTTQNSVNRMFYIQIVKDGGTFHNSGATGSDKVWYDKAPAAGTATWYIRDDNAGTILKSGEFVIPAESDIPAVPTPAAPASDPAPAEENIAPVVEAPVEDAPVVEPAPEVTPEEEPTSNETTTPAEETAPVVDEEAPEEEDQASDEAI